MSPTRRIALMRAAIVVSLVVSAALTAEHAQPAQNFCPLEGACEQAAESPLGSFAGIPTSVIGLAAFGLFLLATLPPPTWSQRLLLPTGVFATSAGVLLLGYQALFLDAFCPLCVVADLAAIFAGGLAIGWGITPDAEARWLPTEAPSARVAWALAGTLAVVFPFALPHSAPPEWEEVTPLAESEFEVDVPDEVLVAVAEQPEPESPSAVAPASPSEPHSFPEPAPEGTMHVSLPMVPEVAPDPTPDPVPEAEPATSPEPPATTEPTPDVDVDVPDTPEPAAPKVTIVEYLNAYCAHCRKTHARLEAVLARFDEPVKRRRIYTWSSNDYPVWARACAYAATVGKEDALFHELMKSRSQKRSEVFAAARRAGLDIQALNLALADPTPPARLVRDRRLNRAARLKGLPTLDIGRRRLMGEQSERKLRAAVAAAIRDAQRE